VGFDQTQTAFPHLLRDGRVIFTRRDYNDRGQSYAHALFTMNQDGTVQTEYYGNNSMAPTSIQHTRQIPNTNKTIGIAGGYHTTQGGKLVIIDPEKGRQNYDGLKFINYTPLPLDQIRDENYMRVGEQYQSPYPIDEENFIVSLEPIGGYLLTRNGKVDSRGDQLMRYKLYFISTEKGGGREMLAADKKISCLQAIFNTPRHCPVSRASSVDYKKNTAVMFVQNVYYGPGIKGIKPGVVKKIRVNEIFYKPITIGGAGWSPPRNEVGPGKHYSGYGWHSVLPAGVGSASFDTKMIIGEAIVHKDGSAMFEVPARKPIYLQLIDKNGDVVQTMRSWATLMPNETFSCVGCHENKNSTPFHNGKLSIAMSKPPQKLKPLHSITGRPFSYPKMVQPIWDKHCISCHAPNKKMAEFDLSSTLVFDNLKGRANHHNYNVTQRKYNQSYLTLLKVKWSGERLDQGRPNKWVNYYTRLLTTELIPPYYAGAAKSGLLQKLRKGHSNVELSEAEFNTISAWIDLNVPYVGEYDEMNIWTKESKEKYKQKVNIRKEQEAIESENIKQFIEAGQK
jgi:hypothetical protein